MYPTIWDFGEISIGSFSFRLGIHSYGLMLAMAFLTVVFMFQRELKRKNLDPALASKLVWPAAIGGIVGAKLNWIIQNNQYSWDALFTNSGLIWYGGLIGGSSAIIYVLKKNKLPVVQTADSLLPLLLLGYAIARIGCFLSGDGDYGPPSDLPWAMAFPNGTVPTTVPVHPTPLYESLMSLVAFATVFPLRKKKELFPGWMIGAYLSLSGIERIMAEFWRINKPVGPKLAVGGATLQFTIAQYTSLLLVAAGIAVMMLASKRGPVAVAARQTGEGTKKPDSKKPGKKKK